ncbi:HAMP domain-containing sensor histidine kinase [Jatrophihabitans sp.]|uniref:sensor histidine kinase n=1 Tax=Jatrophihabitans sp. TaxID=1932789 RepID=UPI0030C7186E|nr:Two-component system, OmpR family, sensor kinase [Jatrophihabitans sp.]
MSAPPPGPPAQPLVGPEFLPYDVEPSTALPPPIAFDDEALREPRPPRRQVNWRAWLPRSLTARLVAGVVTLVLVLVVMTSGGTYLALRSFLNDRLGQQVDSAAQSAAGSPCFAAIVAGAAPRCGLDGAIRSGQHEWLSLLSSSGSTIDISTSGGSEFTVVSLPASIRQKIVADPGRHFDYTPPGGEQLRATAVQLPVSGGYVVIGLSTGDVHNTLHQLLRKEQLIGIAAVLVALFATTYGVQFSLRRLKRVTTTAQEVAAELSPDGAGLDRRVPVVEEGTEVGQLAESMNTLLSAVETQFSARLESERRMRQFLADASHELRTPLTSIRGYAELARMQRAAGDADEDNLGRIESEGTRMSRLVEDLLMLARGDQDSIPRTELVDVAELLDDVVSSSRAAYPDRPIELIPTPSFHVVGDPDQLLRAIRNLVGNAVVHTPPGPPIRVRGVPDGTGVAIQVIDGGPGLPPEEAAHVFERFWRADKARTRVRGGSGLGLSIVASIVQAHGGAVHFESSVEAGSTVTVWLPGVTALPDATA